jgi:hypothetical protein
MAFTRRGGDPGDEPNPTYQTYYYRTYYTAVKTTFNVNVWQAAPTGNATVTGVDIP